MDTTLDEDIHERPTLPTPDLDLALEPELPAAPEPPAAATLTKIDTRAEAFFAQAHMMQLLAAAEDDANAEEWARTLRRRALLPLVATVWIACVAILIAAAAVTVA
jgi:hypothetical protein